MTLSRRRMAVAAFLLLAACGPSQAPVSHEPMSDGRGAHAGSFRAPGTGNDAAAADMNTEAGNEQ